MAFEGGEKIEGLLQFPLAKQADRLLFQSLIPAFEGRAMEFKIAMARCNQLLLQRQCGDGVALLPKLFCMLLAAIGLFFRCSIPQPAQGGQLLAGANAGCVVLGVEGALDPLRQLFLPPVGACCDRQHQSQGP